MKRQILVVLALLLAASGALARPSSQDTDPESARDHAQDLRSVIEHGLAAYGEEGAEGVIQGWIAGGPLEGSKDALTQANMLRTVESWYGPYESHDWVREAELSSRTRVVYAALHFESGAVFARFHGYQMDDGWVMTSFGLHTEVAEVWPTSMWDGHD